MKAVPRLALQVCQRSNHLATSVGKSLHGNQADTLTTGIGLHCGQDLNSWRGLLLTSYQGVEQYGSIVLISVSPFANKLTRGGTIRIIYHNLKNYHIVNKVHNDHNVHNA